MDNLLNSHFHSKEKGCNIKPKEFPLSHPKSLRSPRFLTGQYCKTHEEDLCRCGWEWQWHYGTYNPTANSSRPLTIPFKGFKVIKKEKVWKPRMKKITSVEANQIFQRRLDKRLGRANN